MLDQLPEEAIVEILLKVPVKFLVRCTCVCKSWLNLITDTTFISTHLTITKNLPSSQFLLTHIRSSEESACVLHFKENGFKNYMRHDLSPRLQIKGSCNGLICLVDDAHTFSLWNPSIKASLTLPKSKMTTKICEPFQEFFGFGFELHTNDYKVLHIVRLIHEREPYVGSGLKSIAAELYSLNAGNWKRISCVPHHTWLYSCPSLPFVNGFLHCIASQAKNEFHDCQNVVWAFDVNRETSCNIVLPEDLTHSKPCKLSVSVHGESSIAVLDRKAGQTHWQIWVMKTYAVKESWMKLLFIPPEFGISKVLAIQKNGELVLRKVGGDIVSYDPQSKRIRYLRFREKLCYSSDHDSYADSYVQSLVLLGMGIHQKGIKCKLMQFLSDAMEKEAERASSSRN